MKKILLSLLLWPSILFAANEPFLTFLSGSPAASTLTGSELMYCAQSSASTKCTPSQLLTYVDNNLALSGDVATSIGIATIQPGAVTFAKQANIAADAIPCNATGSSASQTACNPLAVANLMGAMISVTGAQISTTPINLFGTQTVDGVALLAGQAELVTSATIGGTCGAGSNSSGTGGAVSGTACEGIWIVVSAGPWVRPVNFPSGYTIPSNCELTVYVQRGTVNAGTAFRFPTSTAITIDTTNFNVAQVVYRQGTTTTAGTGFFTQSNTSNNPGAIFAGGSANAVGDCVSFSSISGSITDAGNAGSQSLGPCVVSDPNGHPIFQGTTPAVTGSGCSLVAGSHDNSGAIVTTGADVCTLTFGAAFTQTPFFVCAGYNSTVLPIISTAPTTTAVVFTTAAAGTFSYHGF